MTISRRGFIEGAALALPLGCARPKEGELPPGEGAATRTLHIAVNGSLAVLEVEPRRTLAEVLRNDLELTGTKLACERASCGACTVLLDDRPVLSCHLLALQADGRSVQTIEAMSAGAALHPLQQAFIDRDAAQCGYCTPGILMALAKTVQRPASRSEIENAISGNLCRCGAYHHILEAALSVVKR